MPTDRGPRLRAAPGGCTSLVSDLYIDDAGVNHDGFASRLRALRPSHCGSGGRVSRCGDRGSRGERPRRPNRQHKLGRCFLSALGERRARAPLREGRLDVDCCLRGCRGPVGAVDAARLLVARSAFPSSRLLGAPGRVPVRSAAGALPRSPSPRATTTARFGSKSWIGRRCGELVR